MHQYHQLLIGPDPILLKQEVKNIIQQQFKINIDSQHDNFIIFDQEKILVSDARKITEFCLTQQANIVIMHNINTSTNAFYNALLKTMEDSNSCFILTAHHTSMLPKTIQSRCIVRYISANVSSNAQLSSLIMRIILKKIPMHTVCSMEIEHRDLMQAIESSIHQIMLKAPPRICIRAYKALLRAKSHTLNNDDANFLALSALQEIM